MKIGSLGLTETGVWIMDSSGGKRMHCHGYSIALQDVNPSVGIERFARQMQ